MSFIPATSNRDMYAVVAIAVVAMVAVLMRRGAPAPPALPTVPLDLEPPEINEEGDDEAPEAVALTSDGWAFLPLADRDRVRLIPPTRSPELGPGAPPAPDQLQRGDLVGARVRRGSPDHDPWRLEAVGRDGEYRAWRFETEEAARIALALIERCIVRRAEGGDDAEAGISDADFAEAQRREEEIERELAAMPEEDETPGDPARRTIG